MSRPRRELVADYDTERKKQLGVLIRTAIGDMRQTKFAEKLDIKPETLNRYINAARQKNSQAPPSPLMLKKISDLSGGRVSYEYLLRTAGYNPDKYIDVAFSAPDTKTIVRTIESAMLEKGITARGNQIKLDNGLFFLQVPIQGPKFKVEDEKREEGIDLWKFILIDKDPTISSIALGEFSRLYNYYGQLACCNLKEALFSKFYSTDLHRIKVSLVTTQPEVFKRLTSDKARPYSFPYLISGILLNPQGTEILNEDYFESDNRYYKDYKMQSAYKLFIQKSH